MGRILTTGQTKGMDKDSVDKGKGVRSRFEDKATQAKPVKRAEGTRRQKLDESPESGEPTALGLVKGTMRKVKVVTCGPGQQ